MPRLKAGETLFRDESVFEPSHLPEDFLFRDSQVRELAGCAKPALRGGKPQNAFIFGKPATGKTTAVRLLFAKLQEETSRAVPMHVNCQIYSSGYRILSELHKKAFGFVPPETGLPSAMLYDKVFSRMEKEKKALIIALDDMGFHDLREANTVLYGLTRVHEAYPKLKAGVWCISTRNELHRLEDRVRSALVMNTIEFGAYRKEEMKAILKARAIAGLAPSAISDALLEKIAGASADIRHGIELLKKSALLAENAFSTKITEKYAAAAIRSFEPPVSSSAMDDKKIIADLLRKRSRESGELYEDFRKITGASYATFYRLLQRMRRENLVAIEHIGKEKGRTSRIRLVAK